MSVQNIAQLARYSAHLYYLRAVNLLLCTKEVSKRLFWSPE